MIQIGDKIPATTLMEYSEVEGNGCSIGPNPVDTHKASAGKTIAIFASARRVHPHLFGQARARFCGACRGLQGSRCGRDLVPERERRLCHGRLGT